MKKYLLLLLAFAPALEAAPGDPDLNGYVAQYECRAGNPNCDVDITFLVEQNCQVTIVPSDTEAQAEGKVNGGSQFICIEPGEYNYVLDITVSGTENVRKVLRYNAVGDAGDDPWEQLDADQADLDGLHIGGDFWIIHRLTFDADGAVTSSRTDGGDNIFNRVLFQGAGGNMLLFYSSASNNTLQNSVLRQTVKTPGSDVHCIDIGFNPVSLRLVNNEIYDCAGDGIQISQGSNANGLIIENNDIYITPAMYVVDEACAENALDFKGGGTASQPVRAIHNRLWGFRLTDTGCAGTGSFGEYIVWHADSDFVMVKDNIMTNGSFGITSANPQPTQYSIVGNIIFDTRHHATVDEFSVVMNEALSSEVYLNTFIWNTRAIDAGIGSSHDVQCNVVIDTGASTGNSGQFDNNVYYDSPNFSETAQLSFSIIERVSDTTYSAGTIMRRTSDPGQCTAGDDPDCFLYEAQNAGTTGAGEPTYATELGAEFIDGSITWEAVRGDRKSVV